MDRPKWREKIGKAIEIAMKFVKISKLDYLPGEREAIKLLIKAGKAYQKALALIPDIPKDKPKLREKMEAYLIDKLTALVGETRLPSEMPDEMRYFTIIKYEQDILKFLLPQDKPPLLSDGEIWGIQQGNSEWDDKEKGLAVAQAQLDVCVKHYEGDK